MFPEVYVPSISNFYKSPHINIYNILYIHDNTGIKLLIFVGRVLVGDCSANGLIFGAIDEVLQTLDGWKPQPHPGTQVTRPGCFLPDLTN